MTYLHRPQTLLTVAAALISAGCNQNDPSIDASSGIALTGSATSVSGGTSYIYADSTGAVAAAGNSFQATFNNADLPLLLSSYSGIFAFQLSNGSCSSIGTPVASVLPGAGNVVATSFSAVGCADQTNVTMYLDDTQVFDQSGNEGTSLLASTFVIDLAPKVAVVATGNTAINGSGTTELTAGIFKLTGGVDQSVVATFSKAVAPTSLTGAISGCAATLGAGALVSGQTLTVAWPLGNLGVVSVGQTCTLNVSGVKDLASNPEDPKDLNIAMPVVFQ